MNTGTPLDLTPFGAALTAIGIGYWLLVFTILGLIFWRIKDNVGKLVALGSVLVIMVLPVVWHGVEDQMQIREHKARLNVVMERYQMRCKSAGEKISRTVENVEGVVWMKWRNKEVNSSNQFRLDDPYGRDCGGTDCILQLLRVTKGADLNPEEARKHPEGYRFVESVDPADVKRYRYTAVIKSIHTRTPDEVQQYIKNRGINPGPDVYDLALEREPIDQFSARYGIIWEDISTHEDREHWIAGGSVKVVDLQTNEVIAERSGWMVDRGQGSEAGFRSPWIFAFDTSCPEPRRSYDKHAIQDPVTALFAKKILKPLKEGN